MLIAEYFDTDQSADELADPDISVGTVEIDELSVDKLTVAGTALRDEREREEQGVLAKPQPA